jgi:nucleotide-binding universal stress UspA family protein
MTTPFTRILLPYDASEPANAALTYGLALARTGAALDLVYVVDERPLIAQTATTVAAFDPTPLLEALDAQAEAIANDAQRRCRDAHVQASSTIVHELPVSGIVGTAERNGDQLIVMGAHARSGVPRAFLGSTTEGVLRSGTIPILTVRAGMSATPETALFRRVLVAVDDSDPADAAVALAASFSHKLGTACVLCAVFDSRDSYDKAMTYGYDPSPFLHELREHAHAVVERARTGGGFAAGTVTDAIIDDEPATGIIAAAERNGVDAIVMGSHGRRGLQRLFLGSVAEAVVRRSPVPVVMVRAASPTG